MDCGVGKGGVSVEKGRSLVLSEVGVTVLGVIKVRSIPQGKAVVVVVGWVKKLV